jgi:hypothetical protein
LGDQVLVSTYHIYHKREIHASISPTINPSKERFWGPTIKDQQEKKKQKALLEARKKSGSDSTEAFPNEHSGSGAYFLHTPYLAFHGPPVVLYTGDTRHGVPIVLIDSFLFWKKYKLQFGSAISQPGVLDPRGVVCWRHNGGDSKTLKADDKLLKGYKVRTWRLWGESGKKYVRQVKANRKAGIGPDPDVLEDWDSKSEKRDTPACADEVVYLTWTSPFSRNTRQYHFHFGGLDFYWKGTGTVKETRRCGFLVHFNHLKLVARVPFAGHTDIPKTEIDCREVCLAKYTSSIAIQKSGKLDLFDVAIWNLMAEHMPEDLAEVRQGDSPIEKDSCVEPAATEIALVKKTRLYQAIIVTALCMISGEKQKRETLRRILEGLITEGAAGGAGG